MKFSLFLPELHIIMLHSITAQKKKPREVNRVSLESTIGVPGEGLSISLISFLFPQDSQRYSLRNLILTLQVILNFK